nr:MAG TPA: hypothetical protein [Bacteriophage sp.]
MRYRKCNRKNPDFAYCCCRYIYYVYIVLRLSLRSGGK